MMINHNMNDDGLTDGKEVHRYWAKVIIPIGKMGWTIGTTGDGMTPGILLAVTGLMIGIWV